MVCGAVSTQFFDLANFSDIAAGKVSVRYRKKKARPSVWPSVAPGMRIGLYGGSFDPAHSAHLSVAKRAVERLNLNQLWWIVSPQNPLKSNMPSWPLEDRMEKVRQLVQWRRHMRVSDVEKRLKTKYVWELLDVLKKSNPRVQFVWVMGADNMASFHTWRHWNWIVQHVPIAVVIRGGQTRKALGSRMANQYWQKRDGAVSLKCFGSKKLPTWCFIGGRALKLSSTELKGHAQR